MRSQWIPRGEMLHILAALTPANRLACEISMATGLRIGDVLRIKPEQAARGRFTIKEEKTGKARAVRLPNELAAEAVKMSGRFWVFENRLDPKRRRTRQAVYKDLKRAARLFRVHKQVSPHSARKIYAVSLYERSGSLKRVQQLLNHSSEAVTLLYAMADQAEKKHLTARARL